MQVSPSCWDDVVWSSKLTDTIFNIYQSFYRNKNFYPQTPLVLHHGALKIVVTICIHEELFKMYLIFQKYSLSSMYHLTNMTLWMLCLKRPSFVAKMSLYFYPKCIGSSFQWEGAFKCLVNNQQLRRFFHGFLILPNELQSFLRWPVFS